MRTRLRWWQIALIAVAGVTALAGVAVIGLFAWGVLAGFGGTEDRGFQPMDRQDAATALERRGVTVPDGFEFADATGYLVFTGADSYWVRYGAPADFDATSAAVAAANPDFPPLRPVSCADEVVESFVENAGLNCTPTTRLAATTAHAGSSPLPATTAHGTPTDAESLLVVDTGQRVELLVFSNGH
ncbi:hypothetical protein [Mycolicibacterium fallax]|uniref:Uncharacterized protein n=1 Tax=Mycolicibacterium fallax TaxID=1793 RepID=A0A1X1RCX5_MYCFA|nr:hypothetical protein [Mycolicibacterium fallax]ORV03184.1 hypothetical protein AWC04_11160 [Mycolicibacterium fallax]BBY98814.1 hypothetical protein MFAL_22810 [Mycolicibacterium fallax]